MSFISFNQKICSVSDSNLSVLSPAALYGKGIFTTIAVYHRNPFLWDKHWDRLHTQATKIGIDLSEFSEQTVYGALSRIIEINGLDSGRARLTFFDEKSGEIWPSASKRKTSLLITTALFREVREIKLTVSPYPLNSASPLAGIKSCNYLENLLAFNEARSRGFDEAVRLNQHGKIVSACLANLFWLKDEKIFTPGLETGCLAGTMRDFILEKFPVTEVGADLSELETADGIFLSSAGIGIVPVNSFEKTTFDDSDQFSRIAGFFRDFIAENQLIP